MEKFIALLLVMFVGAAVAFGFSLLAAFPIKWLWNYAAVDVLHVAPLDFWHALGLSWLCALLFKSSGSTSK